MTDGTDVMYNKFNVDSSSPPDNPPEHSITDYNCVVATTGHWRISRCNEQHRVVCQVYLPGRPIMTTLSSSFTYSSNSFSFQSSGFLVCSGHFVPA